jgi:C4-dicarboxylate-binding protein DctP
VTGAGMMNATHAFLVVNKAWWEKLPSEVRTPLGTHMSRLEKEMRAEIEVDNKKVFQQIAAKGSQVYMMTPTDAAAFKKALQPVYHEFAPQIGAELVKEAQQEAEKMSKTKK